MKGFVGNIEEQAIANGDFRRVLYTGAHTQLVLMSLQPGEEIGLEVHPENDQFFRIDAGEGEVEIDGVRHSVTDGSAVVVPAGAEHNLINTSGSQELKLYTLYSPPHHKDGIIRATKAEAAANEEEFDGETSEES